MSGIIGVTLLERLVFGVKLFVEKKQHLDIKGVTYCTGSRSIHGRVPFVYFGPDADEVSVYSDSYCVDSSPPKYGLREAV